MSTQQNGNAGNVSANLPSPGNISSATNASPIVIQTSAAHGRQTGDTVRIAGVTANLAANGIWQVIVNDSTHFQLVGSTGTGVGGAIGVWTPLTLGPTFAQPSDGDAAAAASVDVGFAGVADRSAYLAVSTGAYKLTQLVTNALDTGVAAPSSTPWAGAGGGGVGAANTWEVGNFEFVLDDVLAGDVVEIDLATTLYNGGNTVNVNAGTKLYFKNYVPGGSASYAPVSGSAQWNFVPGGVVLMTPITLKGFFTVATTGAVKIQPYMIASVISTVVDLVGDFTFIASIWRPTSMPQ